MNGCAPMRMVWSAVGGMGRLVGWISLGKKDEHAEKRVEYGAISEETRRIKRLM